MKSLFKPPIGIIALDLDGTLLNSEKKLSEANREALQLASEKGIEIVPTTGRFFCAMPEPVRTLPFIHYAITVNGARVVKLPTDTEPEQTLYKAELPLNQALDIMTFLDTQPVIYDCYMDSWGYMSQNLQEKAAQYVPDVHYLKMVRDLRSPVDELKDFLRQKQRDVQKIMMFMQDQNVKNRLLEEIPKRFSNIVVSSSNSGNIEINQTKANKGDALLALAKHLGMTRKNCMSFGDATNDLSMIQAAKYSVAMANALDIVKKDARYITLSNDKDGVRAALEHYRILD